MTFTFFFLRQRPVLLPALVILTLFAYMTSRGVGGTSDSTHYLWAARTLRDTGQLLAPDGTPYRFWGPLYPVLLSFFFSPTAVRVLHGAALLGQLVLWSQIGKWLLPPSRAVVLPWLVALSAAVLVPAKFIWSETVFGVIAAAYFYSLLTWKHTGRLGWLALATAAGFLLPLQRTSGLFLLAGAGAGLLLTGQWRGCKALLLLHWAGCAVGAGAWNYYAEMVAGPPVYQAVRGWAVLWNSMADYGYVLARWFVPLAASWRTLLPGLWVVALLGILGWLWPLRSQGKLSAASSRLGSSADTLQELRLTWWVLVLTLLALLLAINASRAAAGIHDAERYSAVLVGPVGLLVLARWPSFRTTGAVLSGKWVPWAGRALLTCYLVYAAVRAGHNAYTLQHRPSVVWPVETPAQVNQ